MTGLQGYVQSYDGEVITVVAPFPFGGYLLEKQDITECEIMLHDGRHISPIQRKHIYATMRDISVFTGYTPDEVKALAKYDFIATTGCDYFSLSNTDMTTAREFLEHLIEFCLEKDIPTANNLLERSPDISRYIYACLIYKKCVICGKASELHHVDRVGAGRNRKEITHIGMRAEPLCRTHHTEVHNIGQISFDNKYKLYGIKIDRDIAAVYKLKFHSETR